MKSRLLVVFVLVASLIVVLASMIAAQHSARGPILRLKIRNDHAALAARIACRVHRCHWLGCRSIGSGAHHWRLFTAGFVATVRHPGGLSARYVRRRSPALAESWTVSPDGKTWTFNLRPGIKFHDNTALDAAAVADNFNRWWDPAHPAHTGSFDWFYRLFGGFKGDANCKIAGVAALNATQFRLTLTSAYSPLPSILAVPAFAIASPAAIQAGTLAVTPVGSGPLLLTFVQWSTGDRIQLAGERRLLEQPASRFHSHLQSDRQLGPINSPRCNRMPYRVLTTSARTSRWRPA